MPAEWSTWVEIFSSICRVDHQTALVGNGKRCPSQLDDLRRIKRSFLDPSFFSVALTTRPRPGAMARDVPVKLTTSATSTDLSLHASRPPVFSGSCGPHIEAMYASATPSYSHIGCRFKLLYENRLNIAGGHHVTAAIWQAYRFQFQSVVHRLYPRCQE